jgi:hypothetical protein
MSKPGCRASEEGDPSSQETSVSPQLPSTTEPFRRLPSAVLRAAHEARQHARIATGNFCGAVNSGDRSALAPAITAEPERIRVDRKIGINTHQHVYLAIAGLAAATFIAWISISPVLSRVIACRGIC